MSSRRGISTVLQSDTIRMPTPLTTAYSVPPGTRIVFFSGLTAKDSDSQTVAKGDATGQTEHILNAIDETLRQAGGSLDDVIKLTIYLQKREDAPAVGQVRARRFVTGPPPASTMIIAQLMSDDQLVEIEAVAALS
ncbi:pyrimidine utilization protein C [Microbacterium kribbense]|uniref:Pyrimidine utilization protein C n=2 Tax=Microbacterium kribbense TaxID=433645 RepID=A0ABP7GSA1_9MICO